MTGVETDVRSIRLERWSEDYQRFRVEAAEEGLRMAAVAQRSVEDHLSKRKAVSK